MHFTFQKSDDPEVTDSEYVYDLNPNFTVQISHFQGDTFYIANEHGGEGEAFWLRDHGEFTSAEAAMRQIVKVAGIEYALLRSIDATGALTAMNNGTVTWEVSIAAPKPGSKIERLQRDIFTTTDTEKAVRHLFDLMDQGLATVLDSPNLRLFDQKTPQNFGDSLTDAVHDACDYIPDADKREDDWDNTEFSHLRDTVMEVLDTPAQS